jgi:TonB family protein
MKSRRGASRLAAKIRRFRAALFCGLCLTPLLIGSCVDEPASLNVPVHSKDAKVVIVKFTVDESGNVGNPVVIRSDDPAFNKPTIDAVMKWKFRPGKKNGIPTKCWVEIPIVFTLNGTKPLILPSEASVP